MRGDCRAGAVAALMALVLTVTACQGGNVEPESDSGDVETTVETAAPPTPAERLGLAEGWGPTGAEIDKAARIAEGLRLPDLAGQVIVADWSGTEAPVRMVRSLHLGGVIVFDDNVVSAPQIRAVNRSLRKQVARPWPLFIGVDQEGGAVERLRGAATRLPAFMSAGAAASAVLTQSTYAASGGELRGLGFTVNFAPVADVASGPADPTIGSRSASSDPLAVAEHMTAAALGVVSSGVVPVVKHFPGHGSLRQDSHVTLPVQKRSREELDEVELVPFAAAVGAGLPAVMVGHIDVRSIDPGVPSSLSRTLITRVLRKELGFEGLVVTDSLSMAAITRGRRPGNVAVRAVNAGADVLLMPPSPQVARAALVRAVRRGRLDRSRLEQAAARQIAVLLHHRGVKGARPGSAFPASRAMSAAAVTVVSGACEGPLIGAAVHPYGDAAAVAAFSAAAGEAGVSVLQRTVTPARLVDGKTKPKRRKREWRRHYRKRLKRWARDERRRERRLGRWETRESERLSAGTAIGFSGYGDGALDAAIAVATDSPWVLARVTAPVRIATYGDTPGAMQALVDVLLGKAPASGTLPVKVPGVERRGC